MYQWFVVQTKWQKEYAAVENLERQGYTAYCPQIVRARHRRKCWQPVTEPLFPRYLFVQLNIGVDNFAPIRSTIGVQSLVRFGSQPVAIGQRVIDAIRHQEQYLIDRATHHPKWKPGDSVEIINGPFSGLTGLFETKNGEERVTILLQMLGRDNRVTVATNSVVPA